MIYYVLSLLTTVPTYIWYVEALDEGSSDISQAEPHVEKWGYMILYFEMESKIFCIWDGEKMKELVKEKVVE